MSTNPLHMPSEHSTRLDLWLKDATRGLCPEAVERVGREIAEHFDASVCAQLEQGAPRKEAEAAALAALGSAGVARRKLRKANLTKNDVMLLALITGQPVEGLRGPRAANFCIAVVAFLFLAWAGSTLLLSSSHLYDIGILCQACWFIAVFAPSIVGALIYKTTPELGIRAILLSVFRIQCLIAVVIASLIFVQIATVPFSAALDWVDFSNRYFTPPLWSGAALFAAYRTRCVAQKLPGANAPVKP